HSRSVLPAALFRRQRSRSPASRRMATCWRLGHLRRRAMGRPARRFTGSLLMPPGGKISARSPRHPRPACNSSSAVSLPSLARFSSGPSPFREYATSRLKRSTVLLSLSRRGDVASGGDTLEQSCLLGDADGTVRSDLPLDLLGNACQLRLR